MRVRDLAKEFGVSAVTIRADLDELEQRQLAFRVHGGAVPFAAARGERPFEEVATRRADEKARIAALAASIISGGETIVIDVGGGTTDLTLIQVELRESGPRLTRVAVGDHLMLGGDNMDLALAHDAESRLKAKKTAAPLRRMLRAASKKST